MIGAKRSAPDAGIGSEMDPSLRWDRRDRKTALSSAPHGVAPNLIWGRPWGPAWDVTAKIESQRNPPGIEVISDAGLPNRVGQSATASYTNPASRSPAACLACTLSSVKPSKLSSNRRWKLSRPQCNYDNHVGGFTTDASSTKFGGA